MTSTQPLRLALDASVTSTIQADDWQWLQARVKEGKLEVWDSPLALFQLISVVYSAGSDGDDKVGWVKERCARLESVSKSRMLAPSGLLVRHAVREWLKWDGPEAGFEAETEPYLTVRKYLAAGLKQVDSGEIFQILVQPVRHCQKGFFRTLAAMASQMAPELDELRVQPDWNSKEFQKRIHGLMAESRDLRRDLFIHSMRLHGLGDWEMSAVALGWEEVPFVVQLMRLYTLQTSCFIASSRKPDVGDFIDFEWGPQIASGRIDAIVIDRQRSFHEALKAEEKPSVKILSWSELREEFQPA